MQISEFIQRYGLVLKSRPAEVPVASEGTNLDIMIKRGHSEMVTQVSVGEGREFSPVSFMAVLQDSFKMLESQPGDILEGRFGQQIVAGLSATRDNFRTLLGESAFRSFLDEVRLTAPARG